MSSESNTYALITGPTSGIGKALAESFAKNGHNLLLVSRDVERLERLAKQLMQQYSVEALVLASDLSDRKQIERLVDDIQAKSIQIDTLINNAGFTVHGEFSDTKLSAESGMLDCHLLASMALVKAVVPSMKRLGKGWILNVSSLYAFTSVPKQSIYGATKSFLLSFSLALRDELASSGISVCCLCPGITESEFRERAGIKAKDSKLSMSSEKVAKLAYRGMRNDKAIVIPGLINKLFVLLMNILPVSSHSRVTRWVTYTIRGFKH